MAVSTNTTATSGGSGNVPTYRWPDGSYRTYPPSGTGAPAPGTGVGTYPYTQGSTPLNGTYGTFGTISSPEIPAGSNAPPPPPSSGAPPPPPINYTNPSAVF